MTTTDDGAPVRGLAPAKWIPALVACATIGLLAWSAWPTLRPARRVAVVQAVFDRAAPAPTSIAAPRGQAVQAPGWLEAEPYAIACSALADGVIATMEVLEGDRVEAGQVVARLVDADAALRLRRAEADHALALAEVDLARAEHEAALASWESPVELDRAVASGRAALAEARAELAQLPPMIDGAKATLSRLSEELSRTEQSRTSGAATEFEALVARRRVEAQRADLAALEAREPALAARVDRLAADLRAAERTLDLRIEDRRRVDATGAQLRRAEAAAMRADAARDEAALALERMTIRAPVAGVVQRRLKAPGDKVVRAIDNAHSAHIVELYDPERLQVRVDVPLADAAHIFDGQRCEVVVEALPDRTFAGVVLRTTHLADIQKNTLQVKVQVLDPDPLLRPEMLTRVRFLPRGEGSAGVASPGRVLIPEAALGADGSRVWIVTDRREGRGVLRARPVEVLSREDGWASIAGEVPAGALLAVGDGLRDGQRVVVAREGGAS
jgi:RND family efflux transporter MFP subunit